MQKTFLKLTTSAELTKQPFSNQTTFIFVPNQLFCNKTQLAEVSHSSVETKFKTVLFPTKDLELISKLFTFKT